MLIKVLLETKTFILNEYVNSLIRRGNSETRCTDVAIRLVIAITLFDPSIVHKATMGRSVMNRKNPSLSIFDEQQYSAGTHQLVPAKKQSKCKYY